MIDTITLLIPKDKLNFTDKNWDLQSHTEKYSKYVRNPTTEQKESGFYYPRLTGYKRFNSVDRNVKIEFSIPKLLYSNNLQEVEKSQFDKVIKTLQDRLKEMGVLADTWILTSARVNSVHFSKNIILKGGYTANQVISELNKSNITKFFDFARARYINDGQSLYLHNSSHEFVIYDKIQDLKKPVKRSIDKDKTIIIGDLLKNLNLQCNSQEVIRLEVRLKNKQKLNSILKNIDSGVNLSFKEIFKKEISQKILLYYWNNLIFLKNKGLFIMDIDYKDFLRFVYQNRLNIKPNKAIYFVGLWYLIREHNGIRELRSILSNKSNDRTWFRIQKDINEVINSPPEYWLRGWVKQINNSLLNYEIYR